MTDKSRPSNALSDLDWDDLGWDIQPERDLWPEIQSRIRFTGKPKRSLWLVSSVAASVMLAIGAFILSALSFQRAQQTYELQASYVEYQKSQIQLIESQHDQVRAQFAALLNGELGEINPDTVAEVQAVLLTIDQASLQLKEAILAHPMNVNYSTMLARTYQQELKLLNKFKSVNGLPI